MDAPVMDAPAPQSRRSHFEAAAANAGRYRAVFDSQTWSPCKRGPDGIVASTGSSDGWIHVQGPLRGVELRELRDILFDHCGTRQHEWHELLVEGRVVEHVDSACMLCWFVYRTPWPLSNRDTLYAQWLDESLWADGELFVAAWSVVDAEVPPLPSLVRCDFECAFWVRPSAVGLDYRYVQRSNAHVPLVPESLLLSGQCAIVIDEVQGLRRACEAARKI